MRRSGEVALPLVLAVATLASCGGSLPASASDGGIDVVLAPDGGAASFDSSVGDVPFAADVPTSQESCSTSSPGGPTCSGCCNADGDCVTAETKEACGTKGEACVACKSAASCTGGTCVRPQPGCDPSNCTGCCQTDATCADGSQNAACGQAGVQCSSCAGCTAAAGGGGNCGIQPDCNGCATSPRGSCADGVSHDACGIHGEPCHACSADQQCVPSSTSGGTCQDAGACNPQTCPGCCEGATCLYGNQNAACGAGGSVCSNCMPAGQTCRSGACQ
jgi:hypothetical protein